MRNREIDRLIAEHVMGWKVEYDKECDWWEIEIGGRGLEKAETATLAISLATLKAVGVPVEN